MKVYNIYVWVEVYLQPLTLPLILILQSLAPPLILILEVNLLFELDMYVVMWNQTQITSVTYLSFFQLHSEDLN